MSERVFHCRNCGNVLTYDNDGIFFCDICDCRNAVEVD